MRSHFLLSLFFLLIVKIGFTQTFQQEQKIVASDRFRLDVFGRSSLIVNNTLFVGAPFEDISLSSKSAGAVYVFKKQNGQWVEHQKVIASDRFADAFFGGSMEFYENTLYIGAYGWTDTTFPSAFFLEKGLIYAFEEDPQGNWIEKSKIAGPYPDDFAGFGRHFQFHNDQLIVSSSRTDEVSVMEKDPSNTWVEVQSIQDTSYSGHLWNFGVTLKAHKNTLFIRSPFNSTVYVYEKDTLSNKWLESQKLSVPSELDFSANIDILDNTAIIGSPRYSFDSSMVFSPGIGSAFIFTKDSNDTWIETQRLYSADASPWDKGFGQTTKLTKDYAIVSEFNFNFSENPQNDKQNEGSVYLFKRNSLNKFRLHQSIKPTDRQAHALFGSSISIEGSKIYIGAMYNSTNSSDSVYKAAAGALYVFESGKLIGLENEYNLKTNFSIYPNPSSGLFSLKLPNNNATPFEIEVYNSTGKLCLKSKINKDEAESVFNISDFKKGVYHILLYSEGKRFGSKRLLLN